ncbi:hypothetical protein [Mycobacterium sp. ITM-2016-00318]|uniref:hypothetical protein n=1 Tax=Mycobacterium sp. ITM-2016-00318 TaxID=2099693 RepID=UPI000CF8B420|nr:hypothetical protein [Mycobacterium sp. ITM-2016-00318]WNG94177.1 hypothetical protein C6A82_006950 [Mycobacterium sp. ITM-2016-00318]
MIKNVFARYLVLLAVGGSLLGAAAVGLAGTAGATTSVPSGPGYSYAPSVKAKPAPEQKPGWHNHHGVWHVNHSNGR